MTCLKCGFSYVESLPSDRLIHRRVHDETVYGLRSSRFRKCSEAARSGGRSVIVINSESPFVHRQLAQRISLVAAADAPISNVAYAASEKPDERNIHLFIGVEEERARAYVCFERRFHVWQCTWAEYDAGLSHEINQELWSRGFAWVSRAHRRKGWIRRIIAAAAGHLGFGNDFGWYTPFTDDGEAAARALCPSGIFIAK